MIEHSYLYDHIGDPDTIIMQQDTGPSAWLEQPPDSTLSINCIGICVLPFWPKKPAVWFAQFEGQFALSNITLDTTKFHYVILQLDNKYAAEVEDVITNPPPTGHYDRIKPHTLGLYKHQDEVASAMATAKWVSVSRCVTQTECEQWVTGSRCINVGQ